MMVKLDAKNSTQGIFDKTIFDILIENLRPRLNIMYGMLNTFYDMGAFIKSIQSFTDRNRSNEGTALERGKRNRK